MWWNPSGASLLCQPHLASLQPGLEKLDVSLRQGACLDLDIGQTGGEGCDFIILENLAGSEKFNCICSNPPSDVWL